jgi:response regulator RpfG family c-di-GMP phosphodiesterase
MRPVKEVTEHPLLEKKAVEELRKHAGTQFDPGIVKIFTETV